VKAEKYLHVAVGVIKNKTGKILISLRHDKAHQGGLWEFPGGKVEASETEDQALKRELKEELDILVNKVSPLIQIKHQYTDLNVLLDVWTVTEFLGEPKGCEGQEIAWVTQTELSNYSFPEANIPIISAVKLSSEYAILNTAEVSVLIKNLRALLEQGIKLIQARVKSLTASEVTEFVKMAMPLCKQNGAELLVNSAVQNAYELDVDGIHLTSRDLLVLKDKPKGYAWVSASCHNQQELFHAQKIGVDFVVIAPVLATKTHPETEPLGWDAFKLLVDSVNLPTYALGGMQKKELPFVQSIGAQGIAGISCFLQE